MTDIAIEAARLIDILPDDDKAFAFEFIKKMVLAWDPDFTKLTPGEEKEVSNAENSGFIDENDIDWEHIGIDE